MRHRRVLSREQTGRLMTSQGPSGHHGGTGKGQEQGVTMEAGWVRKEADYEAVLKVCWQDLLMVWRWSIRGRNVESNKVSDFKELYMWIQRN